MPRNWTAGTAKARRTRALLPHTNSDGDSQPRPPNRGLAALLSPGRGNPDRRGRGSQCPRRGHSQGPQTRDSEQNAEVAVNLSSTIVHAWERGLFQVLTNLIDNALKYSRDASRPRIQMTSEELADDLRITISDNGIGFDMKYHDRIFGLFNRLVRQEEFEGTGAGLAIAKKLVEKLGGKLWAESTPGAGARLPSGVPARRLGYRRMT